MEVFLELKSTFYKALEEIINIAYKNRKISQKEIYDLLTKHNCNFPELEKRLFAKNKRYQKNIYVLKKQDEKMYSLRINSGILPYITNLEIMWLKFIMSSRYASLFLEKDTIKKIERLKSTMTQIDANIIVPKNYSKILSREDIKKLSPKIKMIVKSILEKKLLIYTYRTRHGTIFKDATGIPVKIQYSLKDDMFYVILYSVEQKNFSKCVIQNLEDIRYDSGNFDREKILKEYEEYLKKSKAKEPIVLEVENTRNALEKAFCIFSAFEKSARFLKEKNKHEIKIFYYNFEEAEIISRILYLGKNVVVTHPEHIREHIIERVKNALETYTENDLV